jgi:CheY-like chemotaxis protein
MNLDAEILAARILVVDDVPANLKLLEDLLAQEGFTQVLGLTESEKVLELAAAFEPDLLLLDLHMPGLDGYAILESLARRKAEGEYLPVCVLTADATREARHKALALGAKDFLTKPFDKVEVVLRVWNLLETRVLYQRLRQHAAGAVP